jgi:hypothetical protein
MMNVLTRHWSLALSPGHVAPAGSSTKNDVVPDVVYLNGDIMEGSEISTHPKIPGWTVPLQLEFDFAREMFRQIRAVAGPRTRVIWGAGNHGLDRIAGHMGESPVWSAVR